MSKNIREAAFLGENGEIIGTGPFHDISALPEHFRVAEEGFIDHNGKFLSREEAGAAEGMGHAVESEEILGKSLKDYEFSGPVSQGGQLLFTARHVESGKAVGSVTISAEPVKGPAHPFCGYHKIGQADVHPYHRGEGIYGRLLQLASLYVKKKLKSKGLVSAGEWRSEKATEAWERLASKSKVVRKPGVDPESPNFFLSERQEVDLQKADAHRVRIPISNLFVLNRWGHPLNPERLDYQIEHDSVSPPVKVELGTNFEVNSGDYVHAHDPQIEGQSFDVGAVKIDLAHPKYFLSDGHHRVKAAQLRGDTHIDAEVHVPEVPHYLRGEKRSNYEAELNSEISKLGAHRLDKAEGDSTDADNVDYEFAVMFRRWLHLRQINSQHSGDGGAFDKSESSLNSLLTRRGGSKVSHSSAHEEVARHMAGYSPESSPEFTAARFLVGGQAASEDAVRTAVTLYDHDLELAALRAYGLPRSDKYRNLLRATVRMMEVADHSPLAKSDLEVAKVPRDIRPAVQSAENAAQAVRRAQAAGAIHPVRFDSKAKHSNGTAIATDPETDDRWLLKPGSGKLSPSAGVREESASQSRREVAFSKLADLLGIGEYYPSAELLVLDGREVAALALLDSGYQPLDKLRSKGQLDLDKLFHPYVEDGSLYKWALLDWVAGNVDRHANNIMVSEDRSVVKLIDHGSAFAGASFDPPNDPKSFIPFYLRASSSRKKWSELTPEERFDEMPSLSHRRAAEFGEWVESINPAELEEVLSQYGISTGPTLSRLVQIKEVPPAGRVQRLMALWAGMLS